MFQEDAGGPLVHLFLKPEQPKNLELVVGVAIFSNGNASSPSVYARMSFYHKFIRTLAVYFMKYTASHPIKSYTNV